MRAFAIAGAVLALGTFNSAAADQVCFPGPTTYKIAICSSQCNAVYCGANLPLLGKKTAASGVFITYHQTSDAGGVGTITVPDGLNDGRAPMRFMADKHTALHVHIDEIPDYSIHVEIKREGSTEPPKDWVGAPNEDFVYDIPESGTYQLHVIHRPNMPGGRTAQYVPTVSLLPSVKQDTAGNSKEKARDLGQLTKDKSIQIEEFLQRINARTADGSLKTEELSYDPVDWFKFTTTVPGKLRAEFRNTPIMDSKEVAVVFGIADAGGPSPVPEGGIELPAGTHYVAAKAMESVVVREFGHHYRFGLTFEPK